MRQTLNYQSNAGVTDVNSQQIRCYTNGVRGVNTLSVAAGSSVTFKSAPTIFHQGPLQFYLAKVPSGQDINSWDGSGNVWFKIYADQMSMQNGQASWPNMSTSTPIFFFCWEAAYIT